MLRRLKMGRGVRAGVLLFGVLLALPALAQTQTVSAMAQLKSFAEKTRSGRADFQQVVVGRSGRKPQQSSGSFAFSRPGKFFWAYERPYSQVLVGDGEKLWSFDKDLNQVTVKKQGQALGNSPASILAGESALERNFILKDIGDREGLEWVEARPRSKEGAFDVARFGFRDGQLRAMELEDNFGQTTHVSFSAFERNVSLDPGLFKFAPPKGADIIGE